MLHSVFGNTHEISELSVQGGGILHEAPQRVMTLTLKHTKRRGRNENAIHVTDPATVWTATADSHVTITAFGPMGTLDALDGVAVYAKSAQAWRNGLFRHAISLIAC